MAPARSIGHAQGVTITPVITVPARVAAAVADAEASGFPMSSEPAVGQLLAVLAAAVPPGGRIAELGTGVGFGTAWLVEGLAGRTDVSVDTVDVSAEQVARTESRGWPVFVRFVVGDALSILEPSSYDMIFADAPAGKTVGLDRTIGALRPGGVLVVDDMTSDVPEEYVISRDGVRQQLFDSVELLCVELVHGSGVILATRVTP